MEDQKKERSSIFDIAGKVSKKEPPSAEVTKKPILSQKELAERYEKYKQLYEKIADTINSKFGKKNLSVEKMKEYFNTPSNFNDATWRLIQSQRKVIEERLKELLQPKPKEKEHGEKKEEQKPKTRLPRSRWMPMR